MVNPTPLWLRAAHLMLGSLLLFASAGCSSPGAEVSGSSQSGDLYRAYLNDPSDFGENVTARENEEMLRCMRATGFDVKPTSVKSDFMIGSEISNLDQVQTWGIGVSTRLYSSNIVDAPAIGINGGGIGATTTDEDFEEMEEYGDGFWEASDRCERNTELALQDTFPAEFQVLAKYEEVSTTPEYLSLRQKIEEETTACMRSKGYAYSETFSWDDDFLERIEQFDASMSELYNPDLVPSGGDLDWQARRAFSYVGGSLTAAQNEELAAIQNEERSVALDLVDCGYFPWDPSADTAHLFENLVSMASDA